MLVFIRCPTCGYPIGSIYDAFTDIKIHLYRKQLNDDTISISNVGVIDYIQLPMGEIFNQLNVKNECCRQHLITNVNFKDAIYN